MRHAFRLAAGFVYGIVLFYFGWIWVGGFMAARQVPGAFFKLFGQEPALALSSFGFHFLPSVVCIVLGTLLFALAFRNQARTVAHSVLAGEVLSYVFWIVNVVSQGAPEGAAIPSKLFAQFCVPWWSWPALVAPVAAFTLAYVAAPKFLPPRAEV